MNETNSFMEKFPGCSAVAPECFQRTVALSDDTVRTNQT
jgi:hypothetical protein